jgi:hypothetical protein
LTLQAWPFAHVGHVPPPQSTPVSFWFVTLSEQVAARHVRFVQTPLWQSEATEHAFVSAHFAHVPPPQSTSVSALSFLPSPHA